MTIGIGSRDGETLTPQVIYFGQVFPPGFARDRIDLEVDGNPIATQCEIKRRHPDGSIRHAFFAMTCLESCAIDFAPDLADPLVAVSDPPSLGQGSLALQILSGSDVWKVSIDFEELLSKLPLVWHQGPLVKERIGSVAIVGCPVRLRVGILHVAPSSYRLEVVFERLAGQERLDYRVILSAIHGPHETLLLEQRIEQWPQTRLRFTRWFGRKPSFHVIYDPEAFWQSGAILELEKDAIPSPWKIQNFVIAHETSDRGIGESGIIERYMPRAGGREDLGLVPGWAACDLTSNESQLRRIHLDAASRSGNFPIHTAHAIDALSRIVYPKGCPLVPDSQHVPSLAYLAYLMTGDAFFEEECEAWARYAILARSPQDRSGADGVLVGDAVRAEAWTLRNVAQYEWARPESKPSSEYSRSITKTLERYRDYLLGSSTIDNRKAHPLGCYRPQVWFKWGESAFFELGASHTQSPWNQDFLLIVLSWMERAGFETASIVERFADWRIGLSDPESGFDPRDGCPGTLAVTKGGVDIDSFPGVWKASFANRPASIKPGSWTSWRGADAYAAYARAALHAVRPILVRRAPFSPEAKDRLERHRRAIDFIDSIMGAARYQPSHAPQWAIR